jgi:hypothetical protein
VVKYNGLLVCSISDKRNVQAEHNTCELFVQSLDYQLNMHVGHNVFDLDRGKLNGGRYTVVDTLVTLLLTNNTRVKSTTTASCKIFT